MAYSVPANLKVGKAATVYQSAVAITPTDGAQIGPFAGIWVGGPGAVNIVPVNQTTPVLLSGIPAGTFLPIAIQGIQSTGTTATLIVGVA